MTEKLKILLTDGVHARGVELLEQADLPLEVIVVPTLPKEELLEKVADVHALVVRSATKVTEEVIEACKNLRAIGRAGIGVDNIDLKAATRRGVVVMNAPDGNTITTAEHTISLMFALARRIPQAVASLANGEWKRKNFVGVEIYQKTLGVVGLGHIGSVVANRAAGLKMRVLACDPFVDEE